MASDEKIFSDLIRYIEFALKSGKTEKEIKEELLAIGHHEDVVLRHFAHLRKRKRKLVSVLFALAVVILLTGTFLLLRPRPSPPLSEPQRFDLAVGLRNISVCAGLNATQDRMACIATVQMRSSLSNADYRTFEDAWNSGDSAACGSLYGYAYDLCMDALDPSLNITTLAQCSQLRTSYMRLYCTSVMHHKEGALTGNRTECNASILPLGSWRLC